MDSRPKVCYMLDVIASNRIADTQKINIKRLNPISLKSFRLRAKEMPQIQGVSK